MSTYRIDRFILGALLFCRETCRMKVTPTSTCVQILANGLRKSYEDGLFAEKRQRVYQSVYVDDAELERMVDAAKQVQPAP